MRFLFVMLLAVVLLPYQVAWSAAAQFCQHESGSASSHFGHHQSPTQPSCISKKVAGDGHILATSHGDHMVEAHVILPDLAMTVTPILPSEFTVEFLQPQEFYQSIPRPTPEVPIWQHLAAGGVALSL